MPARNFLETYFPSSFVEPGEKLHTQNNFFLAEPYYLEGLCTIEGQTDVPFELFWNIDIILHTLSEERPSHIPQTRDESMENLQRIYQNLPEFLRLLQQSSSESEVEPTKALLVGTTNRKMADHLMSRLGFGIVTLQGVPQIYTNQQGEERLMVATSLARFSEHAQHALATARTRGIIR